MKNAKDKPLPKWMESLPGSTPPNTSASAGKKPGSKTDVKNGNPGNKTELMDNVEVVDMDVDDSSTPDVKEVEEKKGTSEWFDGDIEV